MITPKDIENKTMSPEKRKSAKNDYFAFYVGRPLSYILTIPFLYTNISPNAVSLISIIPIIIGFVLMCIGTTKTMLIAGWLMFFLWNLLDGVDGNIARYKKQFSKMGSVYDAMSGYIAMVLSFFGWGVAAAHNPGLFQSIVQLPMDFYIILGALSGIFVIFPRFIMHKAITTLGDQGSMKTVKDAGEWEKLYGSQSDADMAMLSILAFWCGCDEEQMDRIFRTTGLMHDKWDRKQAGTTYGAISIRNAVNSCAAVYTPVNAQDIVDEEFSKLDEDDYIEFQPDLSKITVTLEEMAPHTNARYGRNEIGMGNMFADYGRNTVRIALAAKKLRNVRTINISQLAPDLGNLHQDVICTLKLSSGSVCHNVNASKLL
jgi:hypothetical protein